MGRVTCDPLLAVARTDHFPETPLDVFKQLLLRALVASNFWFDVLTSIGVVVCFVCLFWCLALGRAMVCVGWVWFGLGFPFLYTCHHHVFSVPQWTELLPNFWTELLPNFWTIWSLSLL